MNIIKLKNQNNITSEVKQVVNVLKNSGVAVFPTDTVYGLGGCAKNRFVVEKIYSFKKRSESKPLIIFVPDKKYLKKLNVHISSREKKLIDYCWPGAVTFIFKKTSSSKKKEKIAVRIPDHPFILEILKKIASPLVVTSANISGGKTPVDFCQIEKSILEKADIAVDAGKCPLKKASTIIDVSGEEIKILRQGAVSRKKIMKVLEESQKSKVKSQN